jgi:carboxylesterase type B
VFDVFAAGRQHDVPLITGSVANESSGVPGLPTVEAFVADSREEYGELAERFLSLYPAATDADAFAASAASNGDRIFVAQNWTWARLHGSTASSPTFYYHWSRVPPIPPQLGVCERDPRAFHSSEVPYVFRQLDVRPYDWQPVDEALLEAISSFWLTFAATGDPNRAGLPRWPRFSADAPVAMRFGEDGAGAGPVPEREKLAFWDEYYAQLRGAVPA